MCCHGRSYWSVLTKVKSIRFWSFVALRLEIWVPSCGPALCWISRLSASWREPPKPPWTRPFDFPCWSREIIGILWWYQWVRNLNLRSTFCWTWRNVGWNWLEWWPLMPEALSTPRTCGTWILRQNGRWRLFSVRTKKMAWPLPKRLGVKGMTISNRVTYKCNFFPMSFWHGCCDQPRRFRFNTLTSWPRCPWRTLAAVARNRTRWTCRLRLPSWHMNDIGRGVATDGGKDCSIGCGKLMMLLYSCTTLYNKFLKKILAILTRCFQNLCICFDEWTYILGFNRVWQDLIGVNKILSYKFCQKGLHYTPTSGPWHRRMFKTTPREAPSEKPQCWWSLGDQPAPAKTKKQQLGRQQNQAEDEDEDGWGPFSGWFLILKDVKVFHDFSMRWMSWIISHAPYKLRWKGFAGEKCGWSQKGKHLFPETGKTFWRLPIEIIGSFTTDRLVRTRNRLPKEGQLLGVTCHVT